MRLDDVLPMNAEAEAEWNGLRIHVRKAEEWHNHALLEGFEVAVDHLDGRFVTLYQCDETPDRDEVDEVLRALGVPDVYDGWR